MLKVTHSTTFQARIINAANNMASIDPNLEELMFSIYSVSVSNLAEDDCYALFGTPKEDLLRNYQFA